MYTISDQFKMHKNLYLTLDNCLYQNKIEVKKLNLQSKFISFFICLLDVFIPFTMPSDC